MEISGKIHVSASLSAGKNSHYPLNRRLGGPQRQSGRFEKDKILFQLRGFKHQTLLCAAWSLHRLHHTSSISPHNKEKKLFTDFSYQNLITDHAPFWFTLRSYQEQVPQRRMLE
jgi:hypothetical protein